MRFKLFSFRGRIIILLVLVIGIISSTGFYFFNRKLSDKINKASEANTINIMSLLEDQFYFTVEMHNGKILSTLLSTLETNEQVVKTYLVNDKGIILHPDEMRGQKVNQLLDNSKTELTDHVTLTHLKDNNPPITRAFMNLPNTSECNTCHSPETKNLGHIVMDLSVQATDDNIMFTRKFSIWFTVILFIIIFLVVLLVHNRFISRSIRDFRHIISHVNEGELEHRLSIPQSSELGNLGEQFNTMLDNFQNSQKQLAEFHRKELDQSKRLATIGEMAARLAHEIRNPLTGISNTIEILCQDTGNEENKVIMEEVKRQAQRVNNAITELLRYSRSQELKMIEFDINELISRQISFLKNQHVDNIIQFESNLNPVLPKLMMDAEQLDGALLNLAINAIQAMPLGGTITYTTDLSKSETFVKIMVSDNGPGIPEEIREEIFKPFFTTRTTGTGLGLAITYDIVQKHKGTISIESTPGSGTSFIIELPIS